jgi:hypothetical protein
MTDAIEVTVLRRSWETGEGPGAGVVSLLADVLLESQEKLIPNFLGGGAGEVAGADDFPGGGGPHGIEGRLPERPWPRKGSFGGEAAIFLSFGAVVVDPDVMELVSFDPSS